MDPISSFSCSHVKFSWRASSGNFLEIDEWRVIFLRPCLCENIFTFPSSLTKSLNVCRIDVLKTEFWSFLYHLLFHSTATEKFSGVLIPDLHMWFAFFHLDSRSSVSESFLVFQSISYSQFSLLLSGTNFHGVLNFFTEPLLKRNILPFLILCPFVL